MADHFRLSIGQIERLVDAIVAVPELAGNTNVFMGVCQLTAQELGLATLAVHDQASAPRRTIELVQECAKHWGGLQTLGRAMQVHLSDRRDLDSVLLAIAEIAGGYLSYEERRTLQGILTDHNIHMSAQECEKLLREIRVANSVRRGPMPLWELLRFLDDAEQDGVPAVLPLVGELARYVSREAREDLLKWLRNAHTSRGLPWTPIPAEAPLRRERVLLTVIVQEMAPRLRSASAPVYYEISASIGFAGQPAVYERTATHLVPESEIKATGSDLLGQLAPLAAERFLDRIVQIEVFLPMRLLDHRVEDWTVGANDTTIGLNNPTVVRSFDRLTSRIGHTEWVRRWEARMGTGRAYWLHRDRSAHNKQKFTTEDINAAPFREKRDLLMHIRQRANDLSVAGVCCMRRESERASDVNGLGVAIEVGAPIAVWCRNGHEARGLRRVITGLMRDQTIDTLPDAAVNLRNAARDDWRDDFAILWDNPEQVPILTGRTRFPTGGESP